MVDRSHVQSSPLQLCLTWQEDTGAFDTGELDTHLTLMRSVDCRTKDLSFLGYARRSVPVFTRHRSLRWRLFYYRTIIIAPYFKTLGVPGAYLRSNSENTVEDFALFFPWFLWGIPRGTNTERLQQLSTGLVPGPTRQPVVPLGNSSRYKHRKTAAAQHRSCPRTNPPTRGSGDAYSQPAQS
ncbi:hypothetical protein RRG08_020733 [Elysia crispata]|uniref:Uncharacterized protein n=1 Tax=Elysia crispata TaxID=231223 RepID=A0AAE1AU47_9GAST|nr:hypothetical protein RRG08_020733 [Elysia crispata]